MGATEPEGARPTECFLSWYITVIIIAQFRSLSGTQPAGQPAGQSSCLATSLGVSQSGAHSVRKSVGQSPHPVDQSGRKRAFRPTSRPVVHNIIQPAEKTSQPAGHPHRQ